MLLLRRLLETQAVVTVQLDRNAFWVEVTDVECFTNHRPQADFADVKHHLPHLNVRQLSRGQFSSGRSLLLLVFGLGWVGQDLFVGIEALHISNLDLFPVPVPESPAFLVLCQIDGVAIQGLIGRS